MGKGCSSEAQPGEDGWQGGDYCGGNVVVVVGDGVGGGDGGGGGGSSSDNEFRLTLANACDTACQGGGVVVVVVGGGDGECGGGGGNSSVLPLPMVVILPTRVVESPTGWRDASS